MKKQHKLCLRLNVSCENISITERPNKIKRESNTKSVVNKYMEKIFRFDYDKRIIDKINDDHINTLPFGF